MNNSTKAMVMAPNSSVDPGRPKASFSTLPYEVKLIIYALAEEERVIVFNSTRPLPNLKKPCMWLAI